ncbi:HD domain-containing protein [Alkaliphilus transvaalensis]|uniref:HD domain-containing protein n=1 Tax=Alkaliphilus transvaalensis TaxID=114628 RepID=UPI000479456D|nr:HD domain-containing protein [Alkaliphilus transvaalensis]
MERVNKILSHPKYLENLEKNLKAEKERQFCRHNLQHFLDVARVAYIISLERELNLKKEVVYAAALLHDIGRWKQYQEGLDHAIVSAELAKEILYETGFKEDEVAMILQAIQKHRRGKDLISALDKVLYEGDKLSRPCIECSQINECNRFIHQDKAEIKY